MPTTSIDATYQGRINLTDGPEAKPIDWLGTIRNGTTGVSATAYTTNTLGQTAVGVYNLLTKGAYYVGGYRSFLFFDVSSITSSNTITAATLKVLGYFNNSGGVIPVASTAWGTNGSTSTLSNDNWNDLSFTTTYASAITSWNTSAYNDFTLNATAISAMNSNGYLNCALLNSTYDQAGAALSDSNEFYNGIEFLDGTNNIKVELTYSSAGYANDVNGVAAASIVSVNGVATANIVNINGV